MTDSKFDSAFDSHFFWKKIHHGFVIGPLDFVQGQATCRWDLPDGSTWVYGWTIDRQTGQ